MIGSRLLVLNRSLALLSVATVSIGYLGGGIEVAVLCGTFCLVWHGIASVALVALPWRWTLAAVDGFLADRSTRSFVNAVTRVAFVGALLFALVAGANVFFGEAFQGGPVLRCVTEGVWATAVGAAAGAAAGVVGVMVLGILSMLVRGEGQDVE